ncbi:MAG: hypothetical protein [Bacteriophage sp.]|nr:MAG: hypothetical protein [Bacteriophage sp.]
MQKEHELEMKAEELFNMTFGPLTWNPDDEDEAKDIVDCAVKDGLMAMPDAEDMKECLDDVARDAQEKMRDDIIERVLSVEKTVIKTYTLATGGPAYGVEIRYADCEGHGEVEEVLFWYQDWFTEKAYYSVPDGMQGLVLDVLGVEY